MIATEVNKFDTVRNVFIIDDKGIVRAILVYPMNIGRSIPEVLRMVEALQAADCNNASAPANWCPNDPMIVPSPKTFCELEQRLTDIRKNRNGMNWYLSFQEAKSCKNMDSCEEKRQITQDVESNQKEIK